MYARMNLARKEKALDLDQRAKTVASNFKRAESELIEILQKMDECKAHIDLGYASLYQYTVGVLGLSEGTAYNFITVARKARAVPELHEAVKTGELTVSNARRIAPVLTLENKQEWIEKAKALPQKKLEQELARVFPKSATSERIVYTSAERADLKINVSTELLELAKRAQDLLSQKSKQAVKLEEALELVLKEFVARHDPIEKAKRAKATATDNQDPTRLAPSNNITEKYIPASKRHHVTLRDQGQCSHIDKLGTRCTQKRWLDIHHIKPLSEGGKHEVSNLRTLCAAHHKFEHLHS
jgi:5-methylcytosine-specific restriction endonuclease McrA